MGLNDTLLPDLMAMESQVVAFGGLSIIRDAEGMEVIR
jgi:hypothetical protein